MDGLIDRLVRARLNLMTIARRTPETDVLYRARLLGKAEGVALALSYAEEMRRLDG